MTRIGSLFSGAGGLDVAVETVTDGTTVFQAEVDPHASTVLAAHWPGVPNFGDVTEINWNALRFHINDVVGVSLRPDVVCAGFPCQDVSTAGLRAGLAGKRSGLWSEVVRALDVLRPKAVVIENVRGLLSHTDETGTKAIDVVLGALVELGYSARWTVLPASAVGAPHRRDRVFILGFESDEPTVERIEAPKVGTMAVLPTPQARDGKGHGFTNRVSGPDLLTLLDHHMKMPLLPTPRAYGNDRTSKRAATLSYSRSGPSLMQAVELAQGIIPREFDTYEDMPPSWRAASVPLLPTPRSNDSTGAGIRGEGGINLRQAATLYGTPAWGKYEPAVQRWEALTRPAPYPVEPNKNGRARLVAAFSEWMMGWPRGWVTDVVTTRTHALKIIGNGVVPHQAAAALRLLGLREVLGLDNAA